jgi:hypothetical protein
MKTTKSNSKTSPTTNATQGGTVASLASAPIRNRPKRLETFDFGTIHRHIFRETDCAEWLPCFKNIAVNIGGPFKTRLGSFELTCQFEPISTLLTLIGGKDKSKLTARLVTNPYHLGELRTRADLHIIQRCPFPKFTRVSPRMPFLIVNLKNRTGTFASLDRETLTEIFTAAAFGLLKFRKFMKTLK